MTPALVNHPNGHPYQVDGCRLMRSVITGRYMVYCLKSNGHETEMTNSTFPILDDNSIPDGNQTILYQQNMESQVPTSDTQITNIESETV